MKYELSVETKRFLVTSGASLFACLIVGSIARSVYESEGLPEGNEAFANVPDLLSSLAGIAAKVGVEKLWDTTYLRNYATYVIPPENPPQETWGHRFWRHSKPTLKALGSAAVGAALGNGTRVLLNKVGAPDIDIHSDPVVLNGMFNDMGSTAVAVGVYKGIKPAYENCLKPAWNYFFKPAEQELSVMSINASDVDEGSVQQTEGSPLNTSFGMTPNYESV